ncbi:MAG: phosphoribosylformylglycinamidine synthase subunit PurL [Caldilineaceae bacterium]|nr:phosphoribosylformylglycinamidine synthase subunit PurL [Caldilineaceae bacterium]
MPIRIEVQSPHASAANAILHGAAALGIDGLRGCTLARLYFIEHDLTEAEINRLCTMLLVDPVTEQARWRSVDAPTPPSEQASGQQIVEVTFRPGVTDVPARELARSMAEIGIEGGEVVTGTRYELEGELDTAEVRRLARQLLSNETVQHFSLEPVIPHFGVAAAASGEVERVALTGLSDEELLALSRRRLLSLDANEMRAIQDFYDQLGRAPTDVELETLAQTWSEHCVHKTFRAQIDFTWEDSTGEVVSKEVIDGLLRTYIRAATDAVYPTWLHSAFVDNAGIIAFDDTHDLAFKVETHNHPSALEPFGGANTGVGGVVRDILGVSARPIAATNVLCFGPQEYPHSQLPAGLLHPQRIASGVVAGIADYGNKLGLPTVNGSVLYDEGYLGNPLVFCGCAGLLPTGSHPTSPQAGDHVVVLGGRTGRDGLHGATFSSAELTHDTSETAGSAVQIGDPITEKGLIELIEAARDASLYTAITDCGAGGLSSAVGEMGESLGVDVELTNVLLKYPGLVPWEIWLSEAQERLVIAVPSENLPRLHELAKLWDVEVSVLGTFTGDGDLRVRYAGEVVADLPMEFLHDGLPRRYMNALWREPAQPAASPVIKDAPNDLLLRMLAHPNIASKEKIVRRYDHEVRGGSIVRPFGGPEMDGPNDAAVLKPLGTWDHTRAFALSAGINPQIGRNDPYAMAISAIDEAIRNAVAVGADPDQLAILDNFCWGNPTLPDRLGALVRTCQGCYDGALAYRAPFISGKDSLYNEYNGTPIPGTLLISAIAIVPDMNCTVTAPCKSPGNLLYLVGSTHDELGGSLLHSLYGSTAGKAPGLPDQGLETYRRLHQAMCNHLIHACHDLSEGGLALALAEMALGGRLGIEADIPSSGLSPISALFAESNGRLVVEVAPEDALALEATLAGSSFTRLGVVTERQQFSLAVDGTPTIDLSVAELVSAWSRQPEGVTP